MSLQKLETSSDNELRYLCVNINKTVLSKLQNGEVVLNGKQPPSMTIAVNCWAAVVVLIAILTPDGASLSAHPEGRRKS